VVLFDDKCKPVYDLGGGPYNTVLWSPFGRFLAIAGFGNLPGAAARQGAALAQGARARSAEWAWMGWRPPCPRPRTAAAALTSLARLPPPQGTSCSG
jgi:hypothetical protein